MKARAPTDLLSFDWESIKSILDKCPPDDGNFYMLTFNKGQPTEYRMKFLPYQEMRDFVFLALEKKRLRIKITV